MFSVTFNITTKGQLEPVLDWLLTFDGVANIGVQRTQPPPRAPKSKEAAPAPAKTKAKRSLRAKGTNTDAVLEVIRQTFALPGVPFTPKQIVALAEARGVPRTSFYGAITDLVKMGKLERPKLGYYKLNTENSGVAS